MNEDGFQPGQAVTFEDIMSARAIPHRPGLPGKDEIASMKKDEVVSWLEAHGVEGPTGKVADLRVKLAEIMYMEA